MTRYTVLPVEPVAQHSGLNLDQTVEALVGQCKLVTNWEGDNDNQAFLEIQHPLFGWIATDIWGHTIDEIYEQIVAAGIEAGLVIAVEAPWPPLATTLAATPSEATQ